MGAYQTPFNIGRQVGENFAPVMREARDQGTIQNIIADAQASGDPQTLQNSIGRILSSVSKENQPAAINYLQNMMASAEKKKEQGLKNAAYQQRGLNPYLPESINKLDVEKQQNDAELEMLGLGRGGQPQPQPQMGGMPQPQNGMGQQQDGMPGQQAPSQNPMENWTDQQVSAAKGSQNKIVASMAAGEDKRREAERKAQKEFGETYGKEREKALSKYIDDVEEKSDEGIRSQIAIEEIRKALKGNIPGPGLKAVVKNSQYGKLMFGLNPDETLLKTANKTLLEGTKGLFGSKPTEKEIFILLEDMLPSIGKTKEANEAGLQFIERLNNLKLLRGELVDQLTEGGTKYVPDLRNQVNKALAPFNEKLKTDLQQESEKQQITPVKMRLIDGRTANIPASKVQAALNKGAKLI